MEIILNELFTDNLYILITTALIIASIISAVKKITKLLFISLAALIVFFGYLYYTGESVADTIEQGQEAVEEVKETADDKKEEIEEAKEKVEEELK